ncbi:collagen-like repeat preface domain-containing protein, partial [Bacillus thuringiensis]|uniref:collagen-like repeat preface domain-containing protein n=1 Tax=Bacillus thuringiensis TaxID=1428 RepID=UPI0011A13777
MSPSIPITSAQQTALTNYFYTLQSTATAFITNPSTSNNQALQTVLNSFYNFLYDNYSTFPYTTVAYSQYIMLNTIQSLNQSPISLAQVSQLLQELTLNLQQFVQNIIVDTTTYNTWL